MAIRLRGTGPLSAAYNRRVDRGEAQGLTRSQARGHAIKTEEKTIKDTLYVEIVRGKPKRKDIETLIRRKQSDGYDRARLIRGKPGASKTTQWFDIEDFDDVDDVDDPYSEEGYGVVYSLAFAR